jgi:hypothetical protein
MLQDKFFDKRLKLRAKGEKDLIDLRNSEEIEKLRGEQKNAA